MNPTVEIIQVDVDPHPHQILVGEKILPLLGEYLRKLNLGNRCAIITDHHVAQLLGEKLTAHLEQQHIHSSTISISPGEKQKSLATLETITTQLLQQKMNRAHFLIALGGGVIGDLTGFLASIYMRGIPYITIPTTLLAQIDSSIGGKTGVNTREGKNSLGRVHQPRLVLTDTSLLRTLPQTEYRQGIVEMIKHSLIASPELFSQLEAASFSAKNLTQTIIANIRIKKDIVERDAEETERQRDLLNFGHTIGHGIERASDYTIRHGDAVSLGIVGAAYLSTQKATLEQSSFSRIKDCLTTYHLPTHLESTLSIKKILSAIENDKKIHGDTLRFILLEKIGKAFIYEKISRDILDETLHYLTKSGN